MRAPSALFTASLLALMSSPVVMAADEEKSAWSGSAELGSIRTSGNTSTSSTTGKFEVKHTGAQWDSRLRLTSLNSKDDGETSKEKYTAGVQFDRNVSETTYLAITADQERDRFSGFKYQGTAGFGFGYRAINTDTMHLDLEAGPGYRRDKVDDTGEIQEEAIGRLALKYQWTINEAVKFFEEFTADMGADNNIYRSETGLQSRLNGSLAMNLSYKIKYVDEVPLGSENKDTEFGVTLVYSF
ncbi:DUF481 domain-containing protein [Venatoribacter cucullus]|uniref:DUF481 domain-containing protein n=1 Tax=Venatoribacter cucullus TaxID=2661630 RepID=UPI00223EF599|nr:DUF481 domain-containing protein [Venatoribacter cucullus]UZK02511.1 DUF481 domain-containing protein [Venatoribacter cucullus]